MDGLRLAFDGKGLTVDTEPSLAVHILQSSAINLHATIKKKNSVLSISWDATKQGR